MSLRKKQTTPLCPNCDHVLESTFNFCPHCGQENHDIHLPMSHLFSEVVESILHFDGKFVHTARLLVTKPGELTEDFNAGKRARFVPPVRMYIFVSFIFFMILSLLYGRQSEAAGAANTHAASGMQGVITNGTAVDSVIADTSRSGSRISTSDGKYHFIISGTDEDSKEMNEFIAAKVKKMEADHYHGFIASVFKIISYMMFLLMPFAALLVALAYRKSKRLYIEHLVFSVHFHCFAFMLISVYFLASELIASIILTLCVAAFLCTYLYLSLRRVYKESAVRTAVKTAVLSMTYSTVLFLSVLAAFAASFFLF
ncbi:MAG TPA: DUF3667 domain-containing protein [Bacteroidota bacterium]|nr:DUF3667 domain-containing protein [Bacteroidota bacterium]